MSGRIQQASSVLLVSYSSPVDLCNFWTTEAMGVAVKPCICSAKIGLQELWRQGSEWDEDLPSAVQQKWIALYREIKELNKVSFQGSLSPHQPAEHRPTVCIFADASHGDFGACAYIRWMTINEEHDVRFN